MSSFQVPNFQSLVIRATNNFLCVYLYNKNKTFSNFILFLSNSKYNKDFDHNIQYTRKNAGRMAGPIGKPINWLESNTWQCSSQTSVLTLSYQPILDKSIVIYHFFDQIFKYWCVRIRITCRHRTVSKCPTMVTRQPAIFQSEPTNKSQT